MLSELLRRAREKSGKHQTQIAAEVGVRQPTICGWEAGDNRPAPQYWQRVSAAYGVPLKALTRAIMKDAEAAS